MKSCLKTVTCRLQHGDILAQTLHTTNPNSIISSLWMRLLGVINQVYTYRIKEVGPDRACAEWLVKNGGAVRWVGSSSNSIEKDFNRLPQNVGLKIEEIICDDAVVLPNGFGYLAGLKDVKKFTLHKCRFSSDSMLSSLSHHLADSLEHLQISACPRITQTGLDELQHLKKLQTLLLFDLKCIEDKAACVEQLKQKLPSKCQIDFTNGQKT